MQKATVRIRPLRFAFALDPHDLNSLLRVFEANSVLWGGAYNFILPLFKRVPRRYRRPYGKEITASALSEGLLEAIQPDFLVEVKPGSTTGLSFPRGRVISLDELLARDERGRRSYGVDVRIRATRRCAIRLLTWIARRAGAEFFVCIPLPSAKLAGLMGPSSSKPPHAVDGRITCSSLNHLPFFHTNAFGPSTY
jgi:hypothetical protein